MADIYLQRLGDALQKQINIILFHTLWADEGGGAPLEPMRLNTFRNLVRDLAYDGYHFLSSEEVYQYYMGNWDIPSKNVWLTFDDGFTCADHFGRPILLEYGARASMAPEYNKLGNDSLTGRSSLAGLEDMYNSGVWDIDTHGFVAHGGPPWPSGYEGWGFTGQMYRDRLYISAEQRYMTDEEHKDLIRADLQATKDIIEPVTGRTVRAFQYPMGEYGVSGNDSENIPRLNFEVFDELGLIGFPVTGGAVRVTPYSERHKGRRPAWSRATQIMRSDQTVVPTTLWRSVVRIGDRYLSSGYNYLRWHSHDMEPEGEPFNTDPGVGGNAKVVYDAEAGELWGVGDFAAWGPLDLAAGNFGWHTSNAGRGELAGCYLDADHFYVVAAQNGRIWRTTRASPGSWQSMGYVNNGAEPNWHFRSQVCYADGLLYVGIPSRRHIIACDPNQDFRAVSVVHVPDWWGGVIAISPHALASPNGDPHEWLVCVPTGTVLYRA